MNAHAASQSKISSMKQQLADYVTKEKSDFEASKSAHEHSISNINALQKKLNDVEAEEKDHYSHYQSSIKSSESSIGKLQSQQGTDKDGISTVTSQSNKDHSNDQGYASSISGLKSNEDANSGHISSL